MILEAIVTSLNDDGSANIAPMGPQVEPDMSKFVLRPFQSSATFQNLSRHGEGVLHISDDVELLALAAIGRLAPVPRLVAAHAVRGFILPDACRWFAFRVLNCDAEQDRATIVAEVVDRGWQRDFFGFNRAKHAVLEAAILATRVAFLPRERILDDFQRLSVLVEKTGGDQERRAFALLQEYVKEGRGARGEC